MKKFVMSLMAICTFAVAGICFGQTMPVEQHSQILYRAGSQGELIGAPENFTGNVRISPLFSNNETVNYTGGYVTFAPGARSAWHTHPAGQHLVVIKGVCWTQTWNGEKTIAQVGDAIWCPVGVKHWHGASPDGEMTHLALTGMLDGENVTWLEHVTDDQYYSK